MTGDGSSAFGVTGVSEAVCGVLSDLVSFLQILQIISNWTDLHLILHFDPLRTQHWLSSKMRRANLGKVRRFR